MKKLTTIAIAVIMMTLFTPKVLALEPEQCGKAYGRFTNLSFVYSHLNQEGYPKLHSDIGFAFSKGNTYYLHKPIAGLLRFGIDATWVDLSYAKYKVEERLIGYTEAYNKFNVNEIDYGMQIGASATVNLFKRFQTNAYFRYSPTLLLMVNNSEIQAGFANLFNTGLAVTYGRVGLGIEERFGSSKMRSYFLEEDEYNDDYNYDDDYNDDWTGIIGKRKLLTKLSSLRAFITFRF